MLEVHRPRRSNNINAHDTSSFVQGCETSHYRHESHEVYGNEASETERHGSDPNVDSSGRSVTQNADEHITSQTCANAITTQALVSHDAEPVSDDVTPHADENVNDKPHTDIAESLPTTASQHMTSQPSTSSQNTLYEEIHDYQLTLRGQASGMSEKMQPPSFMNRSAGFAAAAAAAPPATTAPPQQAHQNSPDSSFSGSDEDAATDSSGDDSDSTLDDDNIEEYDIDSTSGVDRVGQTYGRFVDQSPGFLGNSYKKPDLRYLDLPQPLPGKLTRINTDKDNYISQWRRDVMRSYHNADDVYVEPNEYAYANLDDSCYLRGLAHASKQQQQQQRTRGQTLQAPKQRQSGGSSRLDRAYESEDCRGMRMRRDVNERHHVGAAASHVSAKSRADSIMPDRAYESEGGKGISRSSQRRPYSAVYDVPAGPPIMQCQGPCCTSQMYSSQPAMYSYDAEYMPMNGHNVHINPGHYNHHTGDEHVYGHAMQGHQAIYGRQAVHGYGNQFQNRYGHRTSNCYEHSPSHFHALTDAPLGQPAWAHSGGIEPGFARRCNVEPKSEYLSMNKLSLQPQQQQQHQHHAMASSQYQRHNAMTSQHHQQLGPIAEEDENAVLKVPLVNPGLSRIERLKILAQIDENAYSPPYTKTSSYDKKKAKAQAKQRKTLFKQKHNIEDTAAAMPSSQRQFQPIGEEEANYKSNRPLQPIGQEDTKENKRPKASKKIFAICGSAQIKKSKAAKL